MPGVAKKAQQSPEFASNAATANCPRELIATASNAACVYLGRLRFRDVTIKVRHSAVSRYENLQPFPESSRTPQPTQPTAHLCEKQAENDAANQDHWDPFPQWRSWVQKLLCSFHEDSITR